jgi:hypothetical protein
MNLRNLMLQPYFGVSKRWTYSGNIGESRLGNRAGLPVPDTCCVIQVTDQLQAGGRIIPNARVVSHAAITTTFPGTAAGSYRCGVVVYAMFWAIGQMASISITLIYSLGLGNVTLFLMDRLEFLYCEQRGSPVPVAHVFMFARQFRFFPSTKLFWD